MLSKDQGQELAAMFRLMGEPHRLGLMIDCLSGPRGVGELTSRAGISQSLVSHHLRLLRASRLLRAARQGRQVFYEIADDHVRSMLTNMIEHMVEPHPAETADEGAEQ